MMGAQDRVTVWAGDAQDASRLNDWAGQVDLVTARAFGRPALVVECGQPFLSPDGSIVVSDPPEADADRWPAADLKAAGLTAASVTLEDARFTVLHRTDGGPVRLPLRSRKAMEASPLF